jgi:hypothetical protein
MATSAYLCFCGAWHVGRLPTAVSPFPLQDMVAFRSVNLWPELGDRVVANMKEENFGSEGRRLYRVSKRAEVNKRRAKAELCKEGWL